MSRKEGTAMTESATSPQRAGLFETAEDEPRRDPQHDAWLVRTEALLNNFEEAAPQYVTPALGFVIMAADFLWAKHRAQADFAKLDTRAFITASRELLADEETRRGFSNTLCAFYQFLGVRGLIDPSALQAITHQLQTLPRELERQPPALPRRK
jgi:hypothetical protein